MHTRSHGRTRVPFEVPLAATDQAVLSAIEHDLLRRVDVLEASLAKALEALQEPGDQAQRAALIRMKLDARRAYHNVV